RTLHVGPILCSVRVLLSRFRLGQPPLLHPLRHRCSGFVRALRRFYGVVRLPVSVHHRRTSLDFSMRPKRAHLDGHRISRFSRKLLPCLLGSPTARDINVPCQYGSLIVAFPIPKQGRHPKLCPFSRLNTQPASSPVNASPRASPHATHDSGPSWLAKPLTCDSFIHYNLPVYPGALRKRLCPSVDKPTNFGLRPSTQNEGRQTRTEGLKRRSRT